MTRIPIHFAFRGLLLVALASSNIALGQAEQSVSRWTGHFGTGLNVPVAQTSGLAGMSGILVAGVGYRFTHRQSVLVQYYATGLPFNREVRDELSFLSPSSSLYSATANYRYEFRNSRATHPYLIAGTGWYRRVATITRPSGIAEIACSLPTAWWNQACLEGTVPLDKIVASSNLSTLGFNAGGGFSRRIRQTTGQWYVEVRYHHAPIQGVPARTLPIIVGVTW